MIGHRPLVLEDYVSILQRRGWIIALPLVVLPLVAFGISLLIAPQYLSQTLVLIESQKVPDNYVKPVISSNLDSRLASMKEQIFSRSSLQPIIDRYNLYANDHITMEEKLDRARKNIDVKAITSEISHGSGLPGFFISFKAGDPHVAQLVCGEIESLFVGENLRSREASAQGTTTFIKGQLEDAKRNLDEQDAKLANFQRQYIGKLPDESAPNVNMLTSLNTQLEAATQSLSRMEQDKAYAESMLAQQVLAQQAQSTISVSGTPVGPSSDPAREAQILQMQQLQSQESDLSAHYTADYPDVIEVRRKIAELKRQMSHPVAAAAPGSPSSTGSRSDSASVQQLRAQVRSAEIGILAKQREQGQIQSQIHMYQDRIQSSPLVEQQYKQLTRDYTTAQTFYDELLNKMNQSKMATELEKQQEGEQFRVMDEPNLPDQPFSPKRGLYVVGGIVAGLLLGLAVAVLLEYRDTTLRNERDIWAFTQLHTLSVIDYSTGLPTGKDPGRIRRLFASMKTAFTS